jgi:CheY-like chemotaxis protein
LTVINAYAGFIRNSLPDGDRRTEDAQQILMAGNRASVLTRQLLAFGRRQILKPRAFSMNRVVEELAPMLSRLIDDNVEIVTDLDPKLPRVHADPHQLEQVLVNLVVNARDAMPDGGTITIRTRECTLPSDHTTDLPRGRYATLSVTDGGTGIPPEIVRRIFEPFFTTKEVGHGTGLGLSTVHGIARQSGGDITVKSKPGSGTTFTLFLPRHHAMEEARPLETEDSTVTGGSERILFADDDPALRRLAVRVLSQAGYQTQAAPSTEALALLSNGKAKFELLITDVIMPKVGGPALAELATTKAGVNKVLYISGYSHDAVQRIVNSQLAMLPKPFSTTGLLRKVRKVLDGETSTDPEDTLS